MTGADVLVVVVVVLGFVVGRTVNGGIVGSVGRTGRFVGFQVGNSNGRFVAFVGLGRVGRVGLTVGITVVGRGVKGTGRAVVVPIVVVVVVVGRVVVVAG